MLSKYSIPYSVKNEWKYKVIKVCAKFHLITPPLDTQNSHNLDSNYNHTLEKVTTKYPRDLLACAPIRYLNVVHRGILTGFILKYTTHNNEEHLIMRHYYSKCTEDLQHEFNIESRKKYRCKACYDCKKMYRRILSQPSARYLPLFTIFLSLVCHLNPHTYLNPYVCIVIESI